MIIISNTTKYSFWWKHNTIQHTTYHNHTTFNDIRWSVCIINITIFKTITAFNTFSQNQWCNANSTIIHRYSVDARLHNSTKARYWDVGICLSMFTILLVTSVISFMINHHHSWTSYIARHSDQFWASIFLYFLFYVRPCQNKRPRMVIIVLIVNADNASIQHGDPQYGGL